MNKIYTFIWLMVACLAGSMTVSAADETADLKQITDVVDLSFFGNPTGSAYVDYTGIAGTSRAEYNAQVSADKSASGWFNIRQSKNNSGVVSAVSGGKAQSVKVRFGANSSKRTLEIYGKNTPYDVPADLFDEEKQGTLIGTIDYASGDEGENGYNIVVKSLDIEGDYEYIGFKSKSSAIYLRDVEITWLGQERPSPMPVHTLTLETNDEALGTAVFVDREVEGNVLETNEETVEVEAVPANENCFFVNWTNLDGTVVSTESKFTVALSEDITLRANFEARYVVDVMAGEGTDVKLTAGEVAVAAGDRVAAGTVVNLKVDVAKGMQLARLDVNGESVLEKYDAKTGYDITVDGPVAIEAEAAAITFGVKAEIEGKGSVELIVNDAPVALPAQIKMGETVKAVFYPEKGESVSDVVINGRNMTKALEVDKETGASTYSFVVEEETTIQVTFKGAQMAYWCLDRTINGKGNVRLYTDADHQNEVIWTPNWLEGGQTIYCVIEAEEGYTLESIDVNGVAPTVVDNEFSFVLDTDCMITATFVEDASAIESIEADNLGNAEVYTINGVRVRGNVESGLYIIVKNGKAFKAYVK